MSRISCSTATSPRGRCDGPRDLFRAASQSPQTFNTFYVDHRNVAMYTSGSLPVRPKSVDSGLPVDGRGDYEWTGRLPASKHPQGINPRSGLLVNWNNKPAAEFPGADDQFGYGTVGRVDLLNGRLKNRRKHDTASIVSAINAAATQDVRQRVLPVLARLLRTGPAPSARAERMLELLEQWRSRGSSRLDVDLDGKIDDPGAAVMDAAWPKMADAADQAGAGQPARKPAQQPVQSLLRPAGRPVQRLVPVPRPRPAQAASPARRRPVPQPLLRPGQPDPLPRVAVERPRARR